ncbi:DUF6256 family protein [Kitasatospora viridis]|uniref:Uncharacterized protein n=1 Tax=Kitasatospora viridis TaxID=281105 RepID=A0A561TV69_9ACTN|nr:DUF6256 family protein [Kitasatospora viridis]TWF91003.1 hypothetical protein FHX73_12115 [Kitasatospora viridis]
MTPIERTPPVAPLLSVPLTVAVMLAAYVLLMLYLAVGLRTLLRGPDRRPPRAATGRRGWPGLIRQVAATALGGYLLLMLAVLGYYEGVARVPGPFLASAFSGCALLVGLALPVFLAASWLELRPRARRGAGARGRGGSVP